MLRYLLGPAPYDFCGCGGVTPGPAETASRQREAMNSDQATEHDTAKFGVRHRGGVLAVCGRCDDVIAALVRPHNGATKITGLYCLNCDEYIGVWGGYLATKPLLMQRLAWNLSRLISPT